MGPMLIIAGTTITNKKGMHLSAAVEREEFEWWQRKKLGMSRSAYLNIDYESQHKVMATCDINAHRFAIRDTYHWLPSCRRLKINIQLEDDRCPLCGMPDGKSSHFIKFKYHTMEKAFGDRIRNT